MPFQKKFFWKSVGIAVIYTIIMGIIVSLINSAITPLLGYGWKNDYMRYSLTYYITQFVTPFFAAPMAVVTLLFVAFFFGARGIARGLGVTEYIVLIPYLLVGILVCFGFKKVFFEERELTKWNYFLGALMAQTVIFYVFGFLFLLFFADFSIGGF